MSVGDRWWEDSTFNAPAPTGEGDVSGEELLALLTGGTKTNGQFVTLPNGHYVLIDPKTGRVIQDFGAKPAAAGGGGPTGGQQLGFQQDMAALAEQQRQFDLTQGERKARGDQQMRLDSELGRGQLDVSRGNLGVAQGNLGVSQGRLTLDQQMEAFNRYKTLADLASNPRNFVQTYFMNRGYTPPPDVARYGNTPSNAAQIVPYSQFAQQQGMFGAPQAAPRQMAPASAYPTGPLSTPPTAQGGGYASPYEGLSGFSKTGAPYRLAPNDPDAAGLMAKYPGMYQVTGQEEAMKYLPQPRMMARGGTLRMTGPHAVIDLMSGKIRAIAGESGPENAYFDGAAIIDPSLSGDLYGQQDQYLPGYGAGFDTGVESTQTQQTGSQYLPGSEPTPYNVPTTPTQSWSQTDLAAMIEAANAGNPAPTDTHYGLTQATQTQPFIQQAQPIASQLGPAQPPAGPIGDSTRAWEQSKPAEQPNAYATFQNQQQMGLQTTPGGATPIDLAVGSSGQGGLPTATNPQNASVPGSNAPTFGQPIPSQMPTYLAGEDFQGSSDVLRGLQAGGAVPPFMRRIFGQARGDQQFATNTVQRTDLPPDLPLISRLGWEQLSPSEQQGFLSFASSLGVTPEDYLALVYGSSPQGGRAQSPVFGAPLSYVRQ